MCDKRSPSPRCSENIPFVAADDVVHSHGLDLKPFPPHACAASVLPLKAVTSYHNFALREMVNPRLTPNLGIVNTG